MPDSRGFTLIELLVSLTIGGLVIATVFRILAGHARFVEMQGAREEVQQVSRAALELMSSELRAMGSGGLVRAGRDSITFRVPRAWGIVCEAGPGNRLNAVFPSVPGIDFGVNVGLGVAMVPDANGGLEWVAGVTGVGPPENECGGQQLAEGAAGRTLVLDREVPPDIASSLVYGAVMSLHETISYRSSTSGSVEGRWIQRRIGEGPTASYQPFAGPVISGPQGLSFEYFSGEGPVTAPIGDAEVREKVQRIGVIAGFIAGRDGRATSRTKVDTVSISLWNRGCAPCGSLGEVSDE